MQFFYSCPCVSCKRLKTDGTKAFCEAFPKGIPEKILDGEDDHKKPFPGDNGVQYKPRPNPLEDAQG